MKRLILATVIIILSLIAGLFFLQSSEDFARVGAEEKFQDITYIEEKVGFEEIISVDVEKLQDLQQIQEEEKRYIEKNITITENQTKYNNIANQESVNNKNSSKKVFLTFDDGPTTLTPEVLRILEENDVRATFFVIGKLAEENPELIREIYLSGNMVLPHSYTHQYSIYTTFDTFYEDFYKAEETLVKILDIEIPPIFRFPGGSSNHSSFKYGGIQFMPELTKDIKEKGYYYIDWNVSSGDAGPDYNNKDKMIDNILKGANNKDLAVILFHDVPKNTKVLEILPQTINTFKERGYEFRTFRDITDEELSKMVNMRIANKPIIR